MNLNAFIWKATFKRSLNISKEHNIKGYTSIYIFLRDCFFTVIVFWNKYLGCDSIKERSFISDINLIIINTNNVFWFEDSSNNWTDGEIKADNSNFHYFCPRINKWKRWVLNIIFYF